MCAMEILGGPYFAVAAAGESHGPAVTTIVFGCPPGLELARGEIQAFLDRRHPGSSKLGTPRREGDKLLLLSGLFQEDPETLLGPGLTATVDAADFETRAYEQGFTTGEPISAIVLSSSTRPHDYSQFAGPRGEVRPGHTDLVKHYKSKGFTDYRGGGRSSYRSTISDVIGGSIARIFLERTFGTRILSAVCQVGPLRARRTLEDALGEAAPAAVAEQLTAAEFPAVDADFAAEAAELIRRTRREGDSVGARLEVVAVGVPPLVGEPLYGSLKLRLMGSLGGLHAVQSCEYGAGAEVVSRSGSANNDPIRTGGYQRNSHGGLLGGVTTGNPLVFRVGFKPTSSIAKPQQSVRKNLEEIDFQLKRGRHDPCVGIRAGVTLESRMAIELMNAVLAHQASRVDPQQFQLF